MRVPQYICIFPALFIRRETENEFKCCFFYDNKFEIFTKFDNFTLTVSGFGEIIYKFVILVQIMYRKWIDFKIGRYVGTL